MKSLVPSLFILAGAAGLSGCAQKNQGVTTQPDDQATYVAADSSPSLDQMDSGQNAGGSRWADDGAYTAPSTASYSTPSGTTTAADEPLQPAATGASLAATTSQTYVVRKGDTLMQISRNVYGDARRWREIWEANRTRVPDANRLVVGSKLIIPR